MKSVLMPPVPLIKDCTDLRGIEEGSSFANQDINEGELLTEQLTRRGWEQVGDQSFHHSDNEGAMQIMPPTVYRFKRVFTYRYKS